MKTVLAILLALTIGVQSSGRKPGATPLNTQQTCAATDASATPATASNADEIAALSEGDGSWLPPGALVPCAADLVNAGTTFATIDITLDPLGQPLAAYQFEITSDDASFTVVGVEGGEHAAYDHGRPPYFDPVAKQGETDRLILAEYALPRFDAAQLPTEAIRVATVHVMFAGPPRENDDPTIRLTLIAAGNAEGQRIDAQLSHSFRTPGPAPERP